MSEPTKAVFLSYASQDAEAARRICDALRAAGVEVWFDQSELVGGDAWDAKIRRQIAECGLFVPVISANTQARLEGYFRLEWKLAAQRTHTMADEKTFLLPIVIDATRDGEAMVPAEFKTVQWTKLPGGETPPRFAERVQKLLSGEPRAGNTERMGVAPAARRGAARWWWSLPIFGVTMALLLVLKAGREAPAAPTPAATAPLSEARRLAAQARELLLKPSGGPAKFETAVLLCDRALLLDPTDAEVWAIASQIDTNMVRQSFDTSEKRVASAQSKAAKAINLAPRSFEARLALAVFQAMIGGQPVAAEGESALRALHAESPRELRVLYALGVLLRNQGRGEEALAVAEEATRLPGGAVTGFTQQAWALRGLWRFAEADAALDQAIALEPIAGNVGLKVFLDLGWRGDPDRALATMRKLPADELTMDVGVAAAVRLYRWRREPAELLKFLAAVPRDWLPWSIVGPKAALTGDANAELNRPEAARADWQTALALVAQRLAATPNDRILLEWKAYLEASLGEVALAQATWRRSKEAPAYLPSLLNVEKIHRVMAPDQMMDVLEQRVQDVLSNLGQRRDSYGVFISAAELRLNPAWDSIRQLPRFEALQARLDADPRFSPAAKAPAVVASAADSKSVAVLAFANLSDDKANEYFSDGISEELLNVLAKIPNLKVSARTSAFYFKGKEVPVPEIAKQLGVAYVVEGSVRRQGDKVRITAQLIKAADGFHVWSDTFTRDLKDIFAVQDEIAGLIAKNLSLKMGMTAARPTIDVEAYQEYLAGRALFAKASNDDLRAAVGHFEKALAIEPNFTAAWVQLASTHTRLGRWGGTPTLQAWAAARAAIDHAVALEPDSPDVLLALGWIRRTADWDWRGAEQAFRRALQLQPNQPDALAGAAVLLFNIGKTEEAYRLAQQAVQLDPLNASTQIDLSIMFYLNKNWAEAERAGRRALQLAPGGSSYHSILAWGLIGQRRFADAEAEIAQDRDGIDRMNAKGLLAIARGEEKAARVQLAQLEGESRADGDLADLQQSIAWLCAGLGEKDRAFAALEKAAASRDPSMAWLLNSWYLEPLYSDPRWPALVRKLGLAKDQLK